jgi:L-aspartate oxidase
MRVSSPNRLAFDAIVVGGGLAGMLTALDLRPLRTALVSYKKLGEMTSSAWAQGGIAAAVGDDDSPALHAADTVAAGAGLVEAHVAARLAADAPHAIEELASLGVRFDRTDPEHYALSREGAHSRRRILRAGGDATGAELVRAVALAVHETPSVVLFEGARALDVALACTRKGDEETHAVTGLYVRDENGDVVTLSAPAVVLATGGIGGLYRYTTNPIASRGTGIAIAARAGATLADLEFVQFHPTALDVPSDPLPLVSEAVRGEGAFLVDAAGDRIMAGVDPALELAPRDIVARRVAGVHREGRRVYLDARAITDDFAERFPTIFASCMRFGIDPRVAPIPIVAAEHYHMGGIAVDERGRTDVPGLYACGEVAATGVHGANRLASNSLLESVVYPERIAADIRAVLADGSPRTQAQPRTFAPRVEAARSDFDRLRDQMTNAVGVLRTEADLEIARNLFLETAANASAEDLRDAATTSALMAHAALARRESRGGHFRTDFPSTTREERRSSTRLTDIDLHAALAFAADEHTLSTTSG